MSQRPEPTDEDFEGALTAVPGQKWHRFERALVSLPSGLAAMQWKGGERQESGATSFPYVEHGPGVSEFLDSLFDLGVLLPHDWPGWVRDHGHPSAEDLRDGPVADALRYLVALVRADRFSEGTLFTALNNGQVLAVAENMARWRQTQGSGR